MDVELCKKNFLHVKYEHEMLTYSSLYLSNFSKNNSWGIIDSLILEAFLIHARNLINFLYYGSNPENNDEILAESFFDDPIYWKKNKVKISSFMRQQKEDIQHYLAHLTKDRVSLQSKKWNNSQITEEINKAFSQFLQLVPQDRIN